MKILFAEDEPVSRYGLSTVLKKWGYGVVEARNGKEAWQILQRGDAPQLAVLDWVMPEMEGLEVCRRVRQRKRESYTYLLLLTAKAQKEDIIAGLEAGADDYLTKPFDIHELQVRLRAGRRILELQTKLIAAREELRQQATHDPLTGLWNRAAIFDLLRREVARTERERCPFSIVMVDIDHFKHINDTHGHPAGDAVLCELAYRMSASMRPYDEIGRYGGEEFLLILPRCDAPKAVQVAERLRQKVEKEPISTQEGRIFVTASLGVATRATVREEDINTLLRAADRALYRAKQEGRNCVVLDSTEEKGRSAPGPGSLHSYAR